MEKTTFRFNYPPQDIEDAYDVFLSNYDFDITSECTEYQQYLLYETFLEKLTKTFNGHEGNSPEMNEILRTAQVNLDNCDGGMAASSEIFFEIFLHCVKLSLPDLTWVVDEPEEVHIGGYGLFD
jgi:hypothetical protein